MSEAAVQLTDVRVGSINISGVTFVGGAKGATVEELLEVLEKRGYLRTAEVSGFSRTAIIGLAQRLTDNAPDFDQAVRELEHAVEIAVDIVRWRKQDASHDEFVNAVLPRVAERIQCGDPSGGARIIDEALAGLHEAPQRSRIALLEAGVRVDVLRHDAIAVARRLVELVVTRESSERDRWVACYKCCRQWLEEGNERGINFSLLVSTELAQIMLSMAPDNFERGHSANTLGNALLVLGSREA
jgi:hypothetical protein